jgi:chemotaxis protein MotA
MPKPATSASQPVLARAPMIGAAFGCLLVLSPIVLGAHGFLIFFSLGGLVIVVGGVIAVAFMSFETIEVHTALNAILQMFMKQPERKDHLRDDMADIITWSRMIEQRGMHTFQAGLGRNTIEDPFVKYGLNMVLSDYAPDDVRGMMETAADACYERDHVPVDILQAMSSHAPAFGMVGTLVGMVAMLCNLTDNITGIGPSLAVAFLQEIDRRRFRYHLMTEGMALLASKKTPMQIQDRLNSFLRPETHNYFDYFSPAQRGKQPAAVIPLDLKVARA